MLKVLNGDYQQTSGEYLVNGEPCHFNSPREAVAAGINYFDMAGGHAAIFDGYGQALEGLRARVCLQVYFGADYTSGE